MRIEFASLAICPGLCTADQYQIGQDATPWKSTPMPIDGDTTMSRSPISARYRLTAAIVLLIVALIAIASAQAAGPSGEIPDRIFANGFEEPQPPGEVERLPAPDSLLPADALPEIGLRLLDGDLDPAGWRLLVDGEELTSQAQVTGGSILFKASESLFEGEHGVIVRHGLRTWTWNFRTSTPPVIFDFEPSGLLPPLTTRPEIRASYADIGSGIDVTRVRLLVDGVEVTEAANVDTGGVSYLVDFDLPDGDYEAMLEVADVAGNSTNSQIHFIVGSPPEVELLAPIDSPLPHGSAPEIVIRFWVARGEIDPHSIALIFRSDVTDSAQIEMSSASEGTIRYQIPEPLEAGEHQVTVFVSSTTKIEGRAYYTLSVDKSREYTLSLFSPTVFDPVLESDVEVSVRAHWVLGEVGQSHPIRPQSVLIDGEAVGPGSDQDGSFVYSKRVRLEVGPNLIDVRAIYPDGVERELSLMINRAPDLRIEIASPPDWSSFGPVGEPDSAPGPGGARDLTGAVQRPVTITGSTSTPAVSVQINQQQAQLAPDGRSFTFPNYFLHEGANHLSAVATDAHGRSASDHITVYVDQTAPLLTVESPAPESATSLRRIDVRGLVNDAVQAPVETAAPRVRLRNHANGAEAEAVVNGLGYVAEDVPLEVGLNRLEVTALDQHGNARSRSVEIVRTLAGSGRLVALSGHRQHGPAGSLLPLPLVVQAFDANGEPIVGAPVHVDIVRGGGSIHEDQGPDVVDGVNPPRNLVLSSDSEGLVQVRLHLGVDARPGSDVVRFWSPGFAEEAVFSATAEADAPASVHVYGSSGTQYVATDSTPVEALMVQVHDVRHNPVPGTLVEFRIESGEARFTDRSAPAGVIGEDGRTITVQADRNGIAVVRPQAGDAAGTVRILAEAVTETGERIGPIGFHLVVVERQDGPTRLAGTVLDHTGMPLAGVRLSIGRTVLSVVSDETGYFEFAGQVPPGKVDLFVDGRDVRFHRGGSLHEYPALHFEASVIQGQLNQLPHAIYLPPIDLGQAQIVGGDSDVILTLPDFEGFQMRVRANSVTFPDGSRIGPLAIAPVHNDRLPMVPLAAAGRFETVGWTIQPTNTRFDPPIEVRIPNTSGLRPGQTIPIQQWDHDLALFVPMGNGTVNEDGTVIVSDPGSGITKAGWGGGGPPPPPPNTGENQPEQCDRVSGDCDCEPEPSVRLEVQNRADDLIFPLMSHGSPPAEYVELDFRAAITGNCPDAGGEWTSQAIAAPGAGTEATLRFSTPGAHTVTFSGSCGGKCPRSLDPETVDLTVFRVRITPHPQPQYEVSVVPEMPTLRLEATVEPSAVQGQLTYAWRMNLGYVGNTRNDRRTVPEAAPDEVLGVTTWQPVWGNLVMTANQIEVQLETFLARDRGGPLRSTSSLANLIIQGLNPARADVEAAVAGGPWFVDAIVQQESTFRQFLSSPGYPLWGTPNGYGLMQLDPPPTLATVHNWRQNVADGLVRLNQHGVEAERRWTHPTAGQRAQYEAYISNPNSTPTQGFPACGNLANPCVPVHQDIQTGGCSFAHNPIGNQRSFRDGIWIKNYNGATTLWMVWRNNVPGVPYWQNNPLNNRGEDYVSLVCSHIP